MSDAERGAALQLDSFRVRSYRSIRDSGFVPVSPMTALVGREQSGKTNLLHAMRGLEPRIRSPYSLSDDWPRGKKPTPTSDQIVCVARFRLLAAVREQLLESGAVGTGDRGVSVGRTYAGEFVYEAWDGEPNGERMSRGPWQEPAHAALTELVEAWLPEFLFAGHDARVPHAVPLADLASSAEQDQQSEVNGVPALARLLAAVGFSADDAMANLSQRDLEGTAAGLRERLASSGFSHDLNLRISGDRLELSYGADRRSIERLPPVERFQLTLNLRIAAALERRRQPPVLLLDAPGRVFRGGMKHRLRPALQAYADAAVTVVYTARLPFHIELQHPEQVLVLSPSKRGEPSLCSPGPAIGHRVGAREDYTLSAALGMQGRSSFRIDELNLIVEGPTDVDLLLAFHRLFERSGEPGLPADINVVSAGGSYEVVAASVFLARQGLGAIALVDSDDAGISAAMQLARVEGEEPAPLAVEGLLLGQAAGLTLDHAVIEDLVAPELYLAATREVCEPAALEVIERAMDGGASGWNGHIASGIARALAARKLHFPKTDIDVALAGRVAAMESIAEIAPEMAGALRRLFASIRAAAERVCSER